MNRVELDAADQAATDARHRDATADLQHFFVQPMPSVTAVSRVHLIDASEKLITWMETPGRAETFGAQMNAEFVEQTRIDAERAAHVQAPVVPPWRVALDAFDAACKS